MVVLQLNPCMSNSCFAFKCSSKQQGVTFYFLAPWLVFWHFFGFPSSFSSIWRIIYCHLVVWPTLSKGNRCLVWSEMLCQHKQRGYIWNNLEIYTYTCGLKLFSQVKVKFSIFFFSHHISRVFCCPTNTPLPAQNSLRTCCSGADVTHLQCVYPAAAVGWGSQFGSFL